MISKPYAATTDADGVLFDAEEHGNGSVKVIMVSCEKVSISVLG
jgi:hypothetical protein